MYARLQLLCNMRWIAATSGAEWGLSAGAAPVSPIVLALGTVTHKARGGTHLYPRNDYSMRAIAATCGACGAMFHGCHAAFHHMVFAEGAHPDQCSCYSMRAVAETARAWPDL